MLQPKYRPSLFLPLVALALVVSAPLRAEPVLTYLKPCIDKAAQAPVILAHTKADDLLDYYIVGFREGEGGGQAVVTLKSERCELVGSDNVVWPLAQWKLNRPLARALALDALQREIDTSRDGLSLIQKRINQLPAYQLDYLAPEQQWALRQRGIQLPARTKAPGGNP